MPKLRLKNAEVQAEPYRPGLEDEWAHQWRDGVIVGRYPTKEAADDCPHKLSPGYFGASVPVVLTGAGRVPIWPGDWIVTDHNGGKTVMHFHGCSIDVRD